jgi:hypothetical protein
LVLAIEIKVASFFYPLHAKIIAVGGNFVGRGVSIDVFVVFLVYLGIKTDDGFHFGVGLGG